LIQTPSIQAGVTLPSKSLPNSNNRNKDPILRRGVRMHDGLCKLFKTLFVLSLNFSWKFCRNFLMNEQFSIVQKNQHYFKVFFKFDTNGGGEGEVTWGGLAKE
jgi:hypothetical protein